MLVYPWTTQKYSCFIHWIAEHDHPSDVLHSVRVCIKNPVFQALLSAESPRYQHWNKTCDFSGWKKTPRSGPMEQSSGDSTSLRRFLQNCVQFVSLFRRFLMDHHLNIMFGIMIFFTHLWKTLLKYGCHGKTTEKLWKTLGWHTIIVGLYLLFPLLLSTTKIVPKIYGVVQHLCLVLAWRGNFKQRFLSSASMTSTSCSTEISKMYSVSQLKKGHMRYRFNKHYGHTWLS